MSMSTHVYGIVPPDEKWLQMKAVWDACEKAGIETPDEVSDSARSATVMAMPSTNAKS